MPVSDAGCASVADGARDLRVVRVAAVAADAAAGGPAVRDRGTSYRQQVIETVWVAAVFGSGIMLGALMAGAK